jgi:hypothetical protein
MWTTTTLILDTVQYHGNILTVSSFTIPRLTCPKPEKTLLLIFTSVLRTLPKLEIFYILIKVFWTKQMPVDITSIKGFCLEIFPEIYILFMFLFSLFRHYFLKNIVTCLNIKNVFDNL